MVLFNYSSNTNYQYFVILFKSLNLSIIELEKRLKF
ncbi:Uncharacterised protein [Mycobacterium tuberculosis]|nr:Uncharacterised protein [Mycobacterium tuberculosis]